MTADDIQRTMHAADPACRPSSTACLARGSTSSRLCRLIGGALAAFLFAAGASAADLHGKVVGVADGDTITVSDNARAVHKVRLAGIDAPEKSQPYGGTARRHLAGLVLGKHVIVTWHKRDRYGRLVGQVGLAVNVCGRPDCARVADVGLAQVESGLAWHYRQYQKEQSPEDRRRYAAAEQQARAKREGLWRDEQPVPPWEHRGSRRAPHERFETGDRRLVLGWPLA